MNALAKSGDAQFVDKVMNSYFVARYQPKTLGLFATFRKICRAVERFCPWYATRQQQDSLTRWSREEVFGNCGGLHDMGL